MTINRSHNYDMIGKKESKYFQPISQRHSIVGISGRMDGCGRLGLALGIYMCLLWSEKCVCSVRRHLLVAIACWLYCTYTVLRVMPPLVVVAFFLCSRLAFRYERQPNKSLHKNDEIIIYVPCAPVILSVRLSVHRYGRSSFHLYVRPAEIRMFYAHSLDGVFYLPVVPDAMIFVSMALKHEIQQPVASSRVYLQPWKSKLHTYTHIVQDCKLGTWVGL